MFDDIRHLYAMLDQGGGPAGNGGLYFGMRCERQSTNLFHIMQIYHANILSKELFSGGAYIDSTYTATKLGDNFDYPRNSNSGTVVCLLAFQFASIQANLIVLLYQGAHNNYAAINAPWSDTTNSDNIRGGSYAGSAEIFSTNVKHTNSTQPGLYGHSS